MNLNDHVGFFLARDKILAQFVEWGYEPKEIAIDGLDARGYMAFRQDDSGRAIFANGHRAQVKVPWDQASHYEWLVETILAAEGAK